MTLLSPHCGRCPTLGALGTLARVQSHRQSCGSLDNLRRRNAMRSTTLP